MNILRFVRDFAAVFAVTLVVSLLVTLAWNAAVHGVVTIDLGPSFRLAVLFGIIVPWTERRRGRKG